jgi:acetoin utilization protein AcuC
MAKKTALILPEGFDDFNFGPGHPMQWERVHYAMELIDSYGLNSLKNASYVTPVKAEEEEVFPYHDSDYIATLKAANNGVYEKEYSKYGFGPGDNPVFPGMFDFALTVLGCTMTAARLIVEKKAAYVFNIAGGMHHAMNNKASGFCFVNDIAIAVNYLLEKKMKVMYVDIDAHHGDGVQAAFYETDKVLNVSFHENGQTLFPGTGFTKETGKGVGRGYSVNIPLKHGSDDTTFIKAFDEIFPPLYDKFNPDILVSQVGCDMMLTDPLTNLALTSHGYTHAIKEMKRKAKRWLALGGGGYNPFNTSRLWTMVWAVMNDQELDDKLPDSFMARAKEVGYTLPGLNDSPYSLDEWSKQDAISEAQRGIRDIQMEVFPIFKIKVKRRFLDDYFFV